MPGVKADKVVEAFQFYMKNEGHPITAKDFEENLVAKMKNKNFLTDISPLLATGTDYDPVLAAELVFKQLIPRLV